MAVPERPEPILATPRGWSRETGPGWVLHLEPPSDVRLAFAESVARGLEDHPRELSPTFLYDREGSEIFERITEQPEYYQTRTESGILEACADDLRRRSGDSTLVELGSGSSTKTRHLLAAWCRRGPTRYVPIDVSGAALEAAAGELTSAFPSLAVEALGTTYEQGLPLASRFSPLVLVFLGSTIGNFTHAQLDGFLDMLAGQLQPDDRFLLGVDRVKPISRLEAAYNDRAGWTSRFILNIFARMNRDLGTRVPLDAVEHVAYYNDRLERVEMYARFLREVNIELPILGRTFRMAPGEMVLTEISRKFRPEAVAANLNRFGFTLEETHTDTESLFAVLLFKRRRETPWADMRRRALQATLRRVRNRTLELLAPVAEAEGDWPGETRRRLVEELQALEVFERRWLVAEMSSEEASIQAEGSLPAGPAAEGGGSSPPAVEALDSALGALARTHRQALRLLAGASLDPARPRSGGGLLHYRAARHESRRQERMLEAVFAGGGPIYEPVDEDTPPGRPDKAPLSEPLLIPGGWFLMGQEPGPESEDDETPRRRLDVPAFRIDAAPVTQGRYLEFVVDGGYHREELWNEAGRAWLADTGAEAPACWLQRDGLWRTRRITGEVAPDPARPVCHLSWHEAAAYARWAGARLPTEAEWEKAARWDPERGRARTYPWGDAPPTADHANLDHRLWQPMPVGSYPRGRSFFGCHQMLGDVWEWTADAHGPYPGHDPALPDDARFRPGRMVLRGGSWATAALAVNAATRRAAEPGVRTLWAGLRCAHDA